MKIKSMVLETTERKSHFISEREDGTFDVVLTTFNKVSPISGRIYSMSLPDILSNMDALVGKDLGEIGRDRFEVTKGASAKEFIESLEIVRKDLSACILNAYYHFVEGETITVVGNITPHHASVKEQLQSGQYYLSLRSTGEEVFREPGNNAPFKVGKICAFDLMPYLG